MIFLKVFYCYILKKEKETKSVVIVGSNRHKSAFCSVQFLLNECFKTFSPTVCVDYFEGHFTCVQNVF